jgi:hypothetical protein
MTARNSPTIAITIATHAVTFNVTGRAWRASSLDISCLSYWPRCEEMSMPPAEVLQVCTPGPAKPRVTLSVTVSPPIACVKLPHGAEVCLCGASDGNRTRATPSVNPSVLVRKRRICRPPALPV